MKTTKVIKFFGGEQQTIQKLGITRQTLHNWKTAGIIPLQSQPLIEVVSRGAIVSTQSISLSDKRETK